MGVEIQVIRTADGGIQPFRDEDKENLKHLPMGKPLRAEIKVMHNYKFHCKLMALFQFAYWNWAPDYTNFKDRTANKSFENFRRDIVVLAGYYEVIHSMNGKGFRLEAWSLKYSKMDDPMKEKVYNACAQVILSKIMPHYTIEELQTCVDDTAAQMMGFL
jgi:hypothetical protein